MNKTMKSQDQIITELLQKNEMLKIENAKLKLELKELKFNLKQQKAESKKKIADLQSENTKLKTPEIPSPVDLSRYGSKQHKSSI